MKWNDFRRSPNVEDFTDPDKAITPADTKVEGLTINEMLSLTGSQLAKDAGAGDVEKAKEMDHAGTDPKDQEGKTGGGASGDA